MEKNFLEILKNEKEKLFHFYIILGNLEKNKNSLLSFLKKDLNFDTEANNNFYLFSQRNFSIADGRKIRKINSLKNDNTGPRIFVLESQKIELEAQNSLLKTLEEPQSQTIFFVLLPQNAFILDTIKSRARIIQGFRESESELGSNFFQKDFLEREKMIKAIIKKSKDSSESRFEFLNLINSMENFILENKKVFENFENFNFPEEYQKFLLLKEQAQQRGSNLNYILTYLAIR
jgi:DNA polymerase-3 subunit delta'